MAVTRSCVPGLLQHLPSAFIKCHPGLLYPKICQITLQTRLGCGRWWEEEIHPAQRWIESAKTREVITNFAFTPVISAYQTFHSLLLCSHSLNDVPPEPQRNVSIAVVQGAVRPSILLSHRYLFQILMVRL